MVVNLFAPNEFAENAKDEKSDTRYKDLVNALEG
jgi:hypothetical protein